MKQMMKGKMPLSSEQKARLSAGARFAGLKKKISTQAGVVSPGGVAAEIDRKKHGKKKFQRLAKLGKKKQKPGADVKVQG